MPEKNALNVTADISSIKTKYVNSLTLLARKVIKRLELAPLVTQGLISLVVAVCLTSQPWVLTLTLSASKSKAKTASNAIGATFSQTTTYALKSIFYAKPTPFKMDSAPPATLDTYCLMEGVF